MGVLAANAPSAHAPKNVRRVKSATAQPYRRKQREQLCRSGPTDINQSRMTFTAWLKSWDANGGAMMLAELCAAAPAAAATTFTDDDRALLNEVHDSMTR
jgi:hypothetical protein